MEIPEDAEVILDGDEGLLLAEADPATRETYLDRRASAEVRRAAALVSAHEPAVTADGRRVEVVANIGNVAGAQVALDAGAEGVGLLRTEFLYLERVTLPSEEEQYDAYKSILETFGSRPVILRTLDIGGDKELPYLGLTREENPFLGVRAIRLCLARPDLLRPQIRAALRASVAGHLKLMFPMVATVEEVRAARGLVDQWRDELVQEGYPVATDMEIGIMVEIPSAALMADELGREVDFFSIGTNDLAQYTLAADRTNAQVAPLASAFHPAVLRLIKMVVDAAHARGKWVGLCGELAGEPLAIPILLGLGIDEFSMNPPAIPQAKALIRKLTTSEARRVAEGALRLESAVAVQAFAAEAMQPFAG
jgi:phosphotransferase system enzyme I (PtsI)